MQSTGKSFQCPETGRKPYECSRQAARCFACLVGPWSPLLDCREEGREGSEGKKESETERERERERERKT